jgi:hypothetical protein
MFHAAPKIAALVSDPGYIAMKFERARGLIHEHELTEGVETTTVKPLFDGTVKKMFLDNTKSSWTYSHHFG